jgi:hypothetical protein
LELLGIREGKMTILTLRIVSERNKIKMITMITLLSAGNSLNMTMSSLKVGTTSSSLNERGNSTVSGRNRVGISIRNLDSTSILLGRYSTQTVLSSIGTRNVQECSPVFVIMLSCSNRSLSWVSDLSLLKVKVTTTSS